MLKHILYADLRLFDGAAAGTAGAAGADGAAASDAGKSAPDDNIPWDRLKGGMPSELMEEGETGAQSTEGGSVNTPVSAESWQKAKEMFREDYQKDVENSVKRRLKNTQTEKDALQKEVESLRKLRDHISLKYPDVNKDDNEALFEAVKGDDIYLKQRALDNGRTVEQELLDVDRQRELESLRARVEKQQETEALRAQAQEVHRQVAELQKIYPDFTLEKAYENEDFGLQMAFYQKVKGTPNVRAAYEAAFGEELRKQAIHQTADATKAAISQNIRANQYMPSTAGKSSTSKAQVSEFDISNISARELVERKRNGEDISKYFR